MKYENQYIDINVFSLPYKENPKNVVLKTISF